ncbi:RNA polymerase sigma factor [Streptomyces sp. YIM 98790]|uniref:RNA polymerase sigma factor n=1 Tax=Streptomyces sp. YIM 98790 TaxID=2689077 RepID=UPI00140DA7D3|nr:sigma-70 family RNA polymerase sigma factor [Streptomyces sp. YIM 98790]
MYRSPYHSTGTAETPRGAALLSGTTADPPGDTATARPSTGPSAGPSTGPAGTGGRADGLSAVALAERFSRGDPEAVAEVYRRYAGVMRAAALRVLGDRELAMEAVQQGFVQAWRAAGSVDASRDLRPWLSVIAQRAAIDVHRRERNRLAQVPLEDEHHARPAPEGSEADSLERAWLRSQVRTALARLHPDERAVIGLAYFQGLSQREIGHAQGIPLGTVKSRTTRAQRRLAALLAHLA